MMDFPSLNVMMENVSTTTIDGNTQWVGLIADPISHVRTPQALNRLWAQNNKAAVVVPIHVDKDGLPALFQGLRHVKNLKGLIATIPHKQALAGLCDETSQSVAIAGAANVARRNMDGTFSAENFDGEGFTLGLTKAGHTIAQKSIRLIGAGGAASAIALSLLQKDCGLLQIINRTQKTAEDLARRLHEHVPDASIVIGHDNSIIADIVVNGTNLGMQDKDPLPDALDNVVPHAVVAEVIMVPEQTAYLTQAQKKQLQTHAGRPMMEQQLHLIQEFLFQNNQSLHERL